MRTVDLLHDEEERNRLIDVAYSLHECLADFVTDAERLKYNSDEANEATLHRIRTSALNCLADMDLLRTPFKSLVSTSTE